MPKLAYVGCSARPKTKLVALAAAIAAVFYLTSSARGLDGVVVVVDGDTIKLGMQRIRIWGIDAPEMYTQAGRDAKQYLRVFAEGKTVRCLAMDKDRHGRTVAQCWLNGKDLAWYMVEGGHARDWPKYSRGYYARH